MMTTVMNAKTWPPRSLLVYEMYNPKRISIIENKSFITEPTFLLETLFFRKRTEYTSVIIELTRRTV